MAIILPDGREEKFEGFKELGLDILRVALPKPTEELFGIAEKPSAEQISKNLTDTVDETPKISEEKVAELQKRPTRELSSELFPNKDSLKKELKTIIRGNLNEGIINPDTIKSNVRTHLKSKVNNVLLERVLEKKPKSVKGFLDNASRNIQDMVTGVGVLLGSVVNIPLTQTPGEFANNTKNFVQGMFASPQYRSEFYDTYLKPVVDEYKEYRHPLEKAYEDPVDVVLDLTAIFAILGKVGSVAGATTKTTAVSKTAAAKNLTAARASLKAAKTSEEIAIAAKAVKAAEAAAKSASKLAVEGATFRAGKFAEKTGAKLTAISEFASIKNISAVTDSLIRKLPGGEKILEDIGLAADTRKLLQKQQVSFLTARNKVIKAIDDRIKVLSDDEIKLLPMVAEGFRTAPIEASKEFHEALGLMKALAKDQERFGLKVGALTPDVIERRRFQPLAKWLEKESFDLIDPETGKKFGSQKGQGVKFDTPYDTLTGAELQSAIKTIKTYFPEADPVYMRHFFDDNPKNFTNFFLNTKPVRSFKPGFLKKSYGVDGYIGQAGSNITKSQLQEILVRQATENLKWQKNIDLIETLKKHPDTLPLKAGEKALDGYKVFAPDGMIRFYKGTIDLTKELDKAAKQAGAKTSIWDMFEDSVNAAFPTQKNYIGVTGAKLYQVPNAVAGELSKIVKSSNPYIKLFYDKPLDAFRFAALSLYPRWNFNNVIGNAVFSIVSGDIFSPKSFYIYNQAKKVDGLLPDELFGGLHTIERTTSGKLGPAAEIPLVRSTVALHEKLLDTKVVGSFVRAAEATVKKGVYEPIQYLGNLGFKANAVVDDMFKGVGYVNRALKSERKGFINRMTLSLDDSLKVLEDVKSKPGQIAKVVDDVHDWYYYGLNLTDFERRAIRRVVPFYSWMRWASLYSYRIATETPVRANIIKNLTRDFYMFTGQNKLPDYLKGSVPLGNDQDGTVYYLQTKGFNPFSHINDFLSEGVAGVALQSSAPAIKTIQEQATGKDAFLGRQFTRKDITQAFNGQLYKFDPELGTVVEVNETIKPGLLENLMRNYLPQYLLLETLLTGGKERYTAEGLDEILKDIFRDPADRKAVVNDYITQTAEQKTNFTKEFGKAVGINVKSVEPEKEKARMEAIDKATQQILNQEAPILNPEFKNLIKQRVTKEIISGKSKEEVKTSIKKWIKDNTDTLKVLNAPKNQPQKINIETGQPQSSAPTPSPSLGFSNLESLEIVSDKKIAQNVETMEPVLQATEANPGVDFSKVTINIPEPTETGEVKKKKRNLIASFFIPTAEASEQAPEATQKGGLSLLMDDITTGIKTSIGRLFGDIREMSEREFETAGDFLKLSKDMIEVATRPVLSIGKSIVRAPVDALSTLSLGAIEEATGKSLSFDLPVLGQFQSLQAQQRQFASRYGDGVGMVLPYTMLMGDLAIISGAGRALNQIYASKGAATNKITSQAKLTADKTAQFNTAKAKAEAALAEVKNTRPVPKKAFTTEITKDPITVVHVTSDAGKLKQIHDAGWGAVAKSPSQSLSGVKVYGNTLNFGESAGTVNHYLGLKTSPVVIPAKIAPGAKILNLPNQTAYGDMIKNVLIKFGDATDDTIPKYLREVLKVDAVRGDIFDGIAVVNPNVILPY